MLLRTKDMSISVNGQSRVPPGFRFHPTEEELLNYYLRKKVACQKIDLDVIRDVDLNKLEPWDIQEKCRIGSTTQTDWYFFSHKDKKYPTGTRTNRATAAGFWKATGRDKVISTTFKRLGMRKTLVFYKGRAPHGQKSDWIMYEYRLEEHQDASSKSVVSHPTVFSSSSFGDAAAPEDGWVVCRVFKKKNHRVLGSPENLSSINGDAKRQMLHSGDDEALEQIVRCMGRSYKREGSKSSTNNVINTSPCSAAPTPSSTVNGHMRYLRANDTTILSGLEESFVKLPAVESSGLPSLLGDIPTQVDHSRSSRTSHPSDGLQAMMSLEQAYDEGPAVSDWFALDWLIATTHFNGQTSEASRQLASCFVETGGFAFGTTAAATTTTTTTTTNRLGLPNVASGDTQDCCHHGDVDPWSLV